MDPLWGPTFVLAFFAVFASIIVILDHFGGKSKQAAHHKKV